MSEKVPRESIELALSVSCGALVEVWGMPVDGVRRDEARCTFEGFKSENFRGVVFHVRPLRLSCGEWACVQCGSTSAELHAKA